MPNVKFPLIFDSVIGESRQENSGTSYYNEEEISAVIDWFEKLVKTEINGTKICPSDIGIVSPYKEQCCLIREELENNGVVGTTVGSAEVFQGQERRVIIISAVRSSEFVNSKQVSSSNNFFFNFFLFYPYIFLSEIQRNGHACHEPVNNSWKS